MAPTSNYLGLNTLEENYMSGWLIVVTGVIYAYIAGEQAYKQDISMAVVYFGYALANVGLYMAVK